MVGVPLPVLALPSAGYNLLIHRALNSHLRNAVYAPMAAGFSKGDDDPGRYQAKTIALQRLTYLSPSFGYKVTDEFSVGAGLLFSHQAVALEQDIRAPNILVGVLEELQDCVWVF